MRVLLAFLVFLSLAAAPALAQTPGASTSKTGKSAGAPSSPINLNTATQAQLESLPGVGPAAAKRILEFRQKNGNFKKLEDLMNVKGFGEKNFLKLKPYITVTPQKAEPTGPAR
jgi:competence protein ComEA